MLYWAFGSNMSRARLEMRVGPTVLLGCARADRYDLRFHKRGKDGSGKCDAYFTDDEAHSMYGAVFELTDEQAVVLDGFEGADYERKAIEVTLLSPPEDRGAAGDTCDVDAYIVRPNAIVPGLSPFSWYHAFVLTGAIDAGLPTDYIDVIRGIDCIVDPDRARHAENEAILNASV